MSGNTSPAPGLRVARAMESARSDRVAAGRLLARSRAAFTLVEVLVAGSISVFVLATVMISLTVMGRSLNAIGNYADLDRQSREAIDRMARDIRQTGKMTNWNTTNLTFVNIDNTVLSYTYSTNTRILSYTNAGNAQSGNLLTNCTALTFSIFQRTPTNGAVCFYTASNAASAKGILMTFTCVRTNYLNLTDSETIETASIVMRN